MQFLMRLEDKYIVLNAVLYGSLLEKCASSAGSFWLQYLEWWIKGSGLVCKSCNISIERSHTWADTVKICSASNGECHIAKSRPFLLMIGLNPAVMINCSCQIPKNWTFKTSSIAKLWSFCTSAWQYCKILLVWYWSLPVPTLAPVVTFWRSKCFFTANRSCARLLDLVLILREEFGLLMVSQCAHSSDNIVIFTNILSRQITHRSACWVCCSPAEKEPVNTTRLSGSEWTFQLSVQKQDPLILDFLCYLLAVQVYAIGLLF